VDECKPLPEGQRSVSYANLVEVARAIGPAAIPGWAVQVDPINPR
jgi:hypothetical protein